MSDFNSAAQRELRFYRYAAWLYASGLRRLGYAVSTVERINTDPRPMSGAVVEGECPCGHAWHREDECEGLVSIRTYLGDADDQPCRCSLEGVSRG